MCLLLQQRRKTLLHVAHDPYRSHARKIAKYCVCLMCAGKGLGTKLYINNILVS